MLGLLLLVWCKCFQMALQLKNCPTLAVLLDTSLLIMLACLRLPICTLMLCVFPVAITTAARRLLAAPQVPLNQQFLSRQLVHSRILLSPHHRHLSARIPCVCLMHCCPAPLSHALDFFALHAGDAGTLWTQLPTAITRATSQME